MKKISIILSVLILYSGLAVSAEAVDLNGKLTILTENLSKLKKEVEGYIIKVEDKQVYFNLGNIHNIKVGDQFIVKNIQDNIKDPLTGEILGEIEEEVAIIEAIKVYNKFSIAKIIKSTDKVEFNIGDRIIPQDKNSTIAVVTKEGFKEFKSLGDYISRYLSDYLRENDFKIVDQDKINNFSEEVELGTNITKEKAKLLMDELEINIILVLDLYKTKDNLFLYSNIYKQSDKVIKLIEEVITFNQNDQLVKYFDNKDKTKKLKLNYKSGKLNFVASNLTTIDLDQDQNLEIIVSDHDFFKVFDYQNNRLENKFMDISYQSTIYDDPQLLGFDINSDGIYDIIYEGFNYLTRLDGKTKFKNNQSIEDFNRNRPKNIVELNNHSYLVTRDYRHKLRFNLLEDNKFITDFEMKVKENEGYRLAIADVDQDQQKEVVITAYDGKNTFQIKIYSLTGTLEYTLKDNYTAIIDILDVGNQIVTAQEGRLIILKWDGEDYKTEWQDKVGDGQIKDIAIADLNQDQKEEIIVLLEKEKASQIYIYQNKSRQ